MCRNQDHKLKSPPPINYNVLGHPNVISIYHFTCLSGAAGCDTQGAAGSITSDPFSKLSWFPATKEELLDYSAAYIQMMIMGAEMVKNQLDPKLGAANRAPNEYGEMAV